MYMVYIGSYYMCIPANTIGPVVYEILYMSLHNYRITIVYDGDTMRLSFLVYVYRAHYYIVYVYIYTSTHLL